MTGNLCVLPQDELGNAPFDEKRKAYGKMRTRCAAEIAKHKTWTPEAVRARTRKLTDFTVKFLSLDVAGG
jgi:hypothetical protein